MKNSLCLTLTLLLLFNFSCRFGHAAEAESEALPVAVDLVQFVRNKTDSAREKIKTGDLIGAETDLVAAMTAHPVGWDTKVPALSLSYEMRGVRPVPYPDVDKPPMDFRPPYETVILKQLEKSSPSLSRTPYKGNFQKYLMEATGFHALKPSVNSGGGRIIKGSDIKYHDGFISENFIEYSYPAVKVRYHYARHAVSANTLIVVLHGHYSTADNVMGLADIDYTRRSGEYWFLRGHDVIAMSVTNDIHKSAQLNAQLSLYGVQIYGLWSRAVSDVAGHIRKSQKKQRIVLYGLSNGGVIADFVSVFTRAFDIVIVDDILQDWRMTVHENPLFYAGQNYNVHFLRPLLAESSYLDFSLNSQSRKYYLLSLPAIESLVLHEDLKNIYHKNLDVKRQVNFLEKELPVHVFEIGLVDKILENQLGGIRGYHLK